MRNRFLLYGLLGWAMEIFWTGMGSLFKGDPSLRGFSYLWMFPIYGSAILLENVHDYIRFLSWPIRGAIWMVIIYGVEFLSGLLIKLSVGIIPWDYTNSSVYSVLGLIRLDYFPIWFIVGLLFEQVHDFFKAKNSI